MNDTYRGVGYSTGDIGYGRKAAVLVVDWQTAFTDPRYALGGLERLHRARDETAQFLKVARAAGLPIAACYTAYCSTRDMPLWKVEAVRKEFFYGHPCTEMDPKIFDASDFTYCKNAPSMFFQAPLISYLVRENVDTVLVTGCTTSGCVRASAVDACQHGFVPVVVREAVGDRAPGPHEANLFDLQAKYAEVAPLATVLQYLGAP